MDQFIGMSIDPSDYDIRELQDRGEEESIYASKSENRSLESTILRPGYYRELLLLQSGSPDADLSKPYLGTTPSTLDGEVELFEWLEYLAKTGGFKRTHDALRHYRTLGWITEPVEQRLRDYLSGVPEPDSSETRDFEQRDHLLSLIYIGRLASG